MSVYKKLTKPIDSKQISNYIYVLLMNIGGRDVKHTSKSLSTDS